MNTFFQAIAAVASVANAPICQLALALEERGVTVNRRGFKQSESEQGPYVYALTVTSQNSKASVYLTDTNKLSVQFFAAAGAYQAPPTYRTFDNPNNAKWIINRLGGVR